MDISKLPVDLQDLMDHHGHLCFGVLLGYKACKYAVDVIGLSPNMMVMTESENCSTDAVRVLLDCTRENGRLVVKGGGKGQSWAFYNKDEEEGVRLTVNPALTGQLPKDKDEALMHILQMPGNILFMAEPFTCGCSH